LYASLPLLSVAPHSSAKSPRSNEPSVGEVGRTVLAGPLVIIKKLLFFA
jgi:hypothetical protein